MNTLTLGGKPVYDPPDDVIGTNYYAMYSGVDRPSVGQFFMQKTDYDTLAAASGGVATLIMTSGDGTDNLLTFSVKIVMARPASTSVIGATSGTGDMVWVVVRDLRHTLVKPFDTLTTAYNMQAAAIPYAGGAVRFDPSTLNSGSEWTWSGALGDLGISFTATWADLPTWKPRNMDFTGWPLSKTIDYLADLFGHVIGFDYTASNPLSGLSAYVAGVANTTNPNVINAAKNYLLTSGSTSRNTAYFPQKYRVSFGVIDLDNQGKPYTHRLYTKDVVNTGASGPIENLCAGFYTGFYSGAAVANSTELDTLAADLALRQFRLYSATVNDSVYAGVWRFTIDGQIRGILWQSGRQGATTTIRYNGDDDFSNGMPRRSAHTLTNQVVIGTAGALVTIDCSGVRREYKTPFLDAIIVKATGNLTGGGKYNGRMARSPASAPSLTSTLAATDFWADPGADNCYIFNLQEIGQTTHALTDASNAVTHFVGFVWGYHSDGLPIVVVNALPGQTCS